MKKITMMMMMMMIKIIIFQMSVQRRIGKFETHFCYGLQTEAAYEVLKCYLNIKFTELPSVFAPHIHDDL
jgi:hypothetical protein